MEEIKQNIGQRLVWSFEILKSFKHKQEDGTELDLNRFYQISLPHGAPFDETYTVLDEVVAEIKKLEELSKKQAAEQKAKEAQTVGDAVSAEPVDVEVN